MSTTVEQSAGQVGAPRRRIIGRSDRNWAPEPSRLTGVFHPSNSTLTVARATRSRIQAFGMEFDNEGKNGHAAPFSWAG